MNEVCWEWTGAVNESGYGVVKFEEKFWYIHRLSYTIMVEDIPEGLEIDHLCFNTICYNPLHLEAVTPEENKRRQRRSRKTHCVRGHLLEQSNGRQRCRLCHRIDSKKHKLKKKSIDVSLCSQCFFPL